MKRLIETPQIPENALLLDARAKKDYLVGHMQGARHAEFLEKFIIRNPEQLEFFNLTLEAWIQGLGLSGSEQIVVYDAGRDTRAARAAWALEYAGFIVQVLRQGFQGTLETDVPDFVPSRFKLKPNTALLATAEDVLQGQALVIDARDSLEYTGQKIPLGATRGGHIPNAINLDWQELADSNGIKSESEIDTVLENIPKNREIIVHCQSGARSSVLYHALKERGYSVSNYLGSMNEWLNDPNLPVE
jgi:thiosulfate/3-mercaptopyruvate sulfurtransferase